MICANCQDAGTDGAMARVTANETVKAVLIASAETLHAGCRGGTWCDCQHYVGRALSENPQH